MSGKHGGFQKGHIVPEEHKKKLSDTMRLYWAIPSNAAKQRKIMQQYWADPEWRAMIISKMAAKQQPTSLDIRKRIAAALAQPTVKKRHIEGIHRGNERRKASLRKSWAERKRLYGPSGIESNFIKLNRRKEE